MKSCLRRREFIAGLGGSAAWPLAAGAQQGASVRRVGILLAASRTDIGSPDYASVDAFKQGLAGLGWAEGRMLASRSAGPTMMQSWRPRRRNWRA